MRFSIGLERLATFATIWPGIVGARSIPDSKSYSDDNWDVNPENIITRDVCVLSSSASGIYTAICLQEL
ncbi:hypothetical protein ASPVEDRAFT_44409, partial [Aspergillus versicolor CBS 583.65]